MDAMLGEKLSGEEIDGIAIGDEVEVFGDLAQLGEDIVDGEDGGLIVARLLDAVGKYDFFGCVEEEKDIVPNALYLYVGFVAAEGIGEFVGEMVDERLDSGGDRVAVVGDGLVGDFDPVNIEHECSSFA